MCFKYPLCIFPSTLSFQRRLVSSFFFLFLFSFLLRHSPADGTVRKDKVNNLRDYTSWLHEYLAKEVRKCRVRWPYSPSIFSLYIHHTITSLFFVLLFVSYRILPIVQSQLFHLTIVPFTANLLDVKIQERTEGTLNMGDKDRHKFLPRSPAISDRLYDSYLEQVRDYRINARE